MKSIPIKRFSNGQVEEVNDFVAGESLLKVEINDEIAFEVVISPDNVDDFIVGHLVCEGFIKDKSEIVSIVKKQRDPLMNVMVIIEHLEERLLAMKKNYNVIWTECGSTSYLNRKGEKFEIERIERIDSGTIIKLPNKAKEIFEGFRTTGAYHYSVLFDLEGNLVTYSYDIGRHNAFDKMVGKVFNNRLCDLKNTMAYSTGRLSSDIVLKALRCKIPCLISRSAPLEGAVNLAEEFNLTLIGFLRGKRFNLYSNRDCLMGE